MAAVLDDWHVKVKNVEIAAISVLFIEKIVPRDKEFFGDVHLDAHISAQTERPHRRCAYPATGLPYRTTMGVRASPSMQRGVAARVLACLAKFSCQKRSRNPFLGCPSSRSSTARRWIARPYDGSCSQSVLHGRLELQNFLVVMLYR